MCIDGKAETQTSSSHTLLCYVAGSFLNWLSIERRVIKLPEERHSNCLACPSIYARYRVCVPARDACGINAIPQPCELFRLHFTPYLSFQEKHQICFKELIALKRLIPLIDQLVARPRTVTLAVHARLGLIIAAGFYLEGGQGGSFPPPKQPSFPPIRDQNSTLSMTDS